MPISSARMPPLYLVLSCSPKKKVKDTNKKKERDDPQEKRSKQLAQTFTPDCRARGAADAGKIEMLEVEEEGKKGLYLRL